MNIIGDKLYLFGGLSQTQEYLNDLHILDLSSMNWSQPKISGKPPVPRESHTAIVYNSKIVIYGGMNGQRLSDTMFLNAGF
mgnify:CR=1 FL=1